MAVLGRERIFENALHRQGVGELGGGGTRRLEADQKAASSEATATQGPFERTSYQIHLFFCFPLGASLMG